MSEKKSDGGVIEVDPMTQAYLERVSGKKGRQAINAWLNSSGWPSEYEGRLSEAQRLARATELAAKWARQSYAGREWRDLSWGPRFCEPK